MTAVLVRPGDQAAAPVHAAQVTVRRARWHQQRRALVVATVLAVLLLALFCLALALGDFPLTPGDVVASLVGNGTPATDFIVGQLRLPRAGLGVLVGAALGLSGAVFQSLLRNPLASPDIIGITSGASAAAVTALLLLGLGSVWISAFAFVGSVLTAVIMYALAWKQGLNGYRLVLVGIGCAAVLGAVIDFLMTRADVYDAQVALRWLTGSLAGATTGELHILALVMLVLVPLTLLGNRALGVLQLGDDTAVAVGGRVERSRLMLILLAVGLASVAVAAAGPVGFVAFVAGPIARRLTGAPAALLSSALVGAVVTLLSDVVGQHLLPVQLPVGVLTAAVGAPYLLYLLVVSNRVGSGG